MRGADHMADREKYIEVLSKAVKTVKEFNEDAPIKISLECIEDILELLKEQEGKPLRCRTCTICDRTGFCHRWNIEVKEDDYCSFGAWEGC